MDRQGSIDANLTVLIRYLVLSFPQAAILSRSVGERYHVCVIVPYDGSPEKAVQVERALVVELARSIKDFELFLSQLNLPLLFQTCDRYDLRLASRRQQESGCGCHAAEERSIARRRTRAPPMKDGRPHRPAVPCLMARPTFQVRSCQRLPVHCSLYVESEQSTDTGTLWNVSLDGCRISTYVSLQAGTKVGLVILLPDPIGAMLVKTATVCWTRGPDYGLRLLALHPVEADRLVRYVKQTVREAASA